MEVYIAKPCGFCFGAERSLKLAKEASEAGNAYSLGPLLHNEILIENLKKKGIAPVSYEEIINKETEIKKIIIRAHGVPLKQITSLQAKGFEIIDGTCPKVQEIYEIVSRYENKGYQVIVFGDKEHPEVKGIASRILNPIVVKGGGDLDKRYDKKICLVSQTTQRQELYDKLKTEIRKKCNELIGFNTICSATKERQDASQALANTVDLMVVIGGKQSSNTKKLYEVCKKVNEKTHLIQDRADLEKIIFNGERKAGITAGASTPEYVINEVVEELKKY